MSDQDPFWIVWNPANPRTPTYRHFSEAQAIAEAERLAHAFPSSTFIVLQAICLRRVDAMQRIDLRVVNDADIPF